MLFYDSISQQPKKKQWNLFPWKCHVKNGVTSLPFNQTTFTLKVNLLINNIKILESLNFVS